MPKAIQKSEKDKLILDYYKKRGGSVKNGEMINRDKKSRAQLWFQNQIKSGEFVIEDNINELINKTKEELQDIMRGSIDNKNISSSIYHKAKQELEFKNMKEPKKEHVAVKMTETSKNADFIRSDINGQLELGGRGHRFIETRIGKPRMKSPQHGVGSDKSFSETTLGKIFIGIVVLVIGGILLGLFTNWFGLG